MSPEMVERVARMLARAHFGVTGCWVDEAATAIIFRADARYALALAERAAREAFSGAEVEPGNLALLAKAAVRRAVEGT